MVELNAELRELARQQRGVLAVRTLLALGLQRRQIHTMVDNGIWQRPSSRVIALTPAPLGRAEQRWVAAVHFDDFALAGQTALELYGLNPDSDGRIHLVGPRGGWGSALPHWRLHSSANRDSVCASHPPHCPPLRAAAQAMQWAKTERQACFFGIWGIQQGLFTLAQLRGAVEAIPLSPTSGLAKRSLRLIDPGVHSMPEYDFARECRRRGFPEPHRQVRRVDAEGRSRYLDVEFRFNGQSLIVEIDGAGHLDATVQLEDSFRANELSLENSRVMRIPALALRLQPDRVFAQLQRALQRLTLAA